MGSSRNLGYTNSRTSPTLKHSSLLRRVDVTLGGEGYLTQRGFRRLWVTSAPYYFKTIRVLDRKILPFSYPLLKSSTRVMNKFSRHPTVRGKQLWARVSLTIILSVFWQKFFYHRLTLIFPHFLLHRRKNLRKRCTVSSWCFQLTLIIAIWTSPLNANYLRKEPFGPFQILKLQAFIPLHLL